MTKTFKMTAAAALLAATAGAFASQDDARADNAWIASDIATQPPQTLLIVDNNPVLTRDPIAFFAGESTPVPMAAADESVIYLVPAASDTVIFLAEPVYYTYIAGPLVDNSTIVTP